MNQENNSQNDLYQNQGSNQTLNSNLSAQYQNYQPIVNNYSQPQMTQQNSISNNIQNNNKGSKKFGVILIIALIIAIVSIVIFVFNKGDEKEAKPKETFVEKDYKTVGKVDKNANLAYDEDGAFLMWVDGIYTLSGRGTMLVGRIVRGTIKKGDQVQILGINDEVKQTTIERVEIDRKEVESAIVGEYVHLLLKDYHRDEILSGQAVSAPNSIIASTKFEAQLEDVKEINNGGKYDICFNQFCQKAEVVFNTENNDNTVDATIYMEVFQPVEEGFEFFVSQNNLDILAEGKVTKTFK